MCPGRAKVAEEEGRGKLGGGFRVDTGGDSGGCKVYKGGKSEMMKWCAKEKRRIVQLTEEGGFKVDAGCGCG